MRKKLTILAGLFLLIGLITGCNAGLRTAGGSVGFDSALARAKMRQPENPKDTSSQDVSVSDTKEVEIPAGSKMIERVFSVDAGRPVTNEHEYVFSAPAAVRQTHQEQSKSKLGAAQKDNLGETIERLRSLRWLQIVGVILCVGGLFGAFYPPATLVLGGHTVGYVMAGAGLILTVLPSLIVGNEKLLIAGGGVVLLGAIAALWMHYHGGIVSELKVLKNQAVNVVNKIEGTV